MPSITGCNRLQFEPTLQAGSPTTVADSPSGLHVDLHLQPPVLEGGAKTLRCSSGHWSGSPTGFAYIWLLNGQPIAGAESDTYTETETDAGGVLQCEVAATNGAAGPGLAASRAVFLAPVPSPLPSASEGNVKIEGVPTGAGGVLTCLKGAWSGQNTPPKPTFTYQWFKDGAPLAGATHETYELGAGEAPLSLRAR